MVEHISVRVWCKCGWEQWLHDLYFPEDVERESGKQLAIHMWSQHQAVLKEMKHIGHERISLEDETN